MTRPGTDSPFMTLRRVDEAGQSLSDITTGLGVRVLRKGRPIGFWEKAAKSLQPGDRIIEIVPTVA